jgi:hypothetical protein
LKKRVYSHNASSVATKAPVLARMSVIVSPLDFCRSALPNQSEANSTNSQKAPTAIASSMANAGGELQGHSEHEGKLERTRHRRAGKARDSQRNERHHEALEGDHGSARVVGDQLADRQGEQGCPQ